MLFQQYEPIFLASRSPRRRELLTQIGVNFELLDIEIDESIRSNEKPIDYVSRMATEKAQAGWSSSKISTFVNYQARALLAADTSVVLADQVLGKPNNLEQAREMLTHLSNNTHQVITSVAVLNKQALTLETSVTDVTFAKLTEKIIEDYCKMGEGMDKAGGYAIQGLAAQFVTTINGSYSGVVGLPLYQTALLLNKHFSNKH